VSADDPIAVALTRAFERGDETSAAKLAGDVPDGDARADALREAIAEVIRRRLGSQLELFPHAAGFLADGALDVVRPVLSRAEAAEAARARTEMGYWRQRAETAEAAVERVRKDLTAALAEWQPEHDRARERADRKGYSHDETEAEVYAMAINTVTGILAALDHPEETP
jgi:hypothetical protein